MNPDFFCVVIVVIADRNKKRYEWNAKRFFPVHNKKVSGDDIEKKYA
jgi:hypothetical protein